MNLVDSGDLGKNESNDNETSAKGLDNSAWIGRGLCVEIGSKKGLGNLVMVRGGPTKANAKGLDNLAWIGRGLENKTDIDDSLTGLNEKHMVQAEMKAMVRFDGAVGGGHAIGGTGSGTMRPF